MKRLLEDKVAVITGAGQGIGKAVAIAFGKEKAKVVVTDINEETIKQVVKEINNNGGEAIAIRADVVVKEEVTSMIDKAVQEFGRLNILVNNAGFIRDSMIHKMTEEQWDEVMAVHTKGTFNCIRAVAPYMMKKHTENNSLGGGRIINVTSGAGLNGNFGQVNYSAAKAAIVGITRTVAREWARFGICVNAIAPLAKTAMTMNMPVEMYKEFIKNVPLGRIGDPELDIAPVFVFLASEMARYITGQVICVDGGIIMK